MTRWRTGPEYEIPWARYPFVKIVLPFGSGILCWDTNRLILLVSVVLLLLLLVGLIYFHRLAAKHFKYVYWFGFATLFFWFFAGLIWGALHDERNASEHFYKSGTDNKELIINISYLDEKEKFWDCYTTVHHRIDTLALKPTGGNLLLRIPKNSTYLPSTGDVLQAVVRIRVPNPASSPEAFDWQKMLHRRNIHYYAYLDTTRFKVIFKAIPGWLERTRYNLDESIRSLVPSSRDYPVASAMLLGLKKKMDPELYQAYSGTGAVHILAVSGLHVGIIAHIFQVLFGFISYKGHRLKLLQVVLILMVIWAYTFLTGAAPSILRSALMFSLLHCSRLLQRDAPPLNILAAAAFILLFIQPLDIYNLGFQLSFAAMAGIFILYEPIRSWISTGNKIIQGLWKVMAVSMAAQLLIYPIIAYHFHQFAFYFWLTGLLSTPFSYMILITGMITLMCYPIVYPFLPTLGLPLQYSVKWMNDSVAWIYSLPLGRIQGWWPTPWDVILLVTISLLLGYMHFQKTRFAFLVFLLTCIGFFGSMIVEEKLDQNKIELVAGGQGDHQFVWIKDKMNTILYTMNDDTMKLPFPYLERYNLPPAQVVRYDWTQSLYSSGNLKLTGNTICFKNKIYQLILNRSDTLVDDSRLDQVIVLDKEWIPQPLHRLPVKIHTTTEVQFPYNLNDGPLQVYRANTPYITIRLK